MCKMGSNNKENTGNGDTALRNSYHGPRVCLCVSSGATKVPVINRNVSSLVGGEVHKEMCVFCGTWKERKNRNESCAGLCCQVHAVTQ